MATCTSKFVLGINHLDLVLRTLQRHQYEPHRYFDLGLRLGLLKETLTAIKANNVRDVHACLRECLSAWLHRSDNVTEPTWETLISALWQLNEKGIADLIKKENFLPLYDRSVHGEISNEEHAANIFERHERTFRKHLRNPKNVATLLRQEDDSILPKDLDMHVPLKRQRNSLESELAKAIKNDFTVLWKFIRVCKRTGNENVAEALSADYENAFPDESPSKAQIKLKDVALAFAKAICSNDPQSDVILRKCLIRYRLKIPFGTPETIEATADDIIRNLECTPYNIAPLEEIARELKPTYPQAYKCIRDHVQYIQESDISIASFDPANSQMPPLQMERLIINFKCISVTTIQEWKIMLDEIFGPSYAHIVKLQGYKANTIFAVFSPEHATWLIKKIREKQDYCRDKQIMEVTIGCCQERIGDEKDFESMKKELEELKREFAGKLKNLEKTIEQQKMKAREKESLSTQHADLMQEKVLLEQRVKELINDKERYENSIQCLQEQLAVFKIQEGKMEQQVEIERAVSKKKLTEIEDLQVATKHEQELKMLHELKTVREDSEEKTMQIEIMQRQKRKMLHELEAEKAIRRKILHELEAERAIRRKTLHELECLKKTVHEQQIANCYVYNKTEKEIQLAEMERLRNTIKQKDERISELSKSCDNYAVVASVTHSRFSQTHSRTFKVILLGDTAVGKTCLARLYIDREVHQPMLTMHPDLTNKEFAIDGVNINLELWDTAGMEQFRRGLVNQYYHNLDGSIFVYDITKRESFEHLEDWFSEMRQYSRTEEGRIKCLLLGNKSDLEDQREVSIEEGRDFAEAYDMLFSEITAKSNDCLNTLDTFIECLLRQMFVIRVEDNLKLTLTQCCTKNFQQQQ